jgi:hypothetical protein
MRALSHFENVSKLATSTVQRILVNETLRKKLTADDEIDAQVVAVREALIEENNRMAAALAQSARQRRVLDEQLAQKTGETAMLQQRSVDDSARLAEVVATLHREQSRREELEHQVAALASTIASREMESTWLRQKSSEIAFATVALFMLVLLGICVFVVVQPFAEFFALQPPAIALILSALALLVWISILTIVGWGKPSVSGLASYGYFRVLRAWLLGGGVALPLLLAALYDWLKSALVR